ncbi:hypothetical protein ACTXT7_002936 [Hymenolepis weldensis]
MCEHSFQHSGSSIPLFRPPKAFSLWLRASKYLYTGHITLLNSIIWEIDDVSVRQAGEKKLPVMTVGVTTWPNHSAQQTTL